MSVRVRSTVMPCVANQVWARYQNPAAVTACSSVRISEQARRVRVGGAVTAIEAAEAFSAQDRLHRRRRESQFLADVGRTPGRPAAGGDRHLLLGPERPG